MHHKLLAIFKLFVNKLLYKNFKENNLYIKNYKEWKFERKKYEEKFLLSMEILAI